MEHSAREKRMTERQNLVNDDGPQKILVRHGGEVFELAAGIEAAKGSALRSINVG